MNPEFKNVLSEKFLNKNNILKAKEKFKSAKPYQHIQIKNFLKKEYAEKILLEAEKLKFKEKESDLFSFKQTDDLYFSKNQFIKKFHSAFCSRKFFNFISEITGEKFSGTMDMSATLYESGSFLLPHDDKLDGRKIAYILYLSKNFSQKDGGSFIVYNSKSNHPTTTAKKYLPDFNSLLLFKVSKNSFHEVEENISSKKRYAIGGWIK